jgi:N-acetylneuraminate synthase
MSRCFVIAEAGVNHNGSVARALELVDAAAAAAADAVKFQFFRAGQLIAAHAPMADYQVRNTGAARSQRDMVRELELDAGAMRELAQAAGKRRIEFMATPFDVQSLDELLGLGMQRVKVSSGDLTCLDFLWQVARRGKPVILSTGMATLAETAEALGATALGYLGEKADRRAVLPALRSVEGRRALEAQVTVLHCTTEYPAPLEAINLAAMATMRAEFGLPVGYSDHSLGVEVSIAAAALGACMIEKHFTLDQALPGPDHKASLSLDELRTLVRSIRNVELARGSGEKVPSSVELRNRDVARRSLVALRAIRAGEAFDAGNLGCKRPGTGVAASQLWEYLGRRATRDYAADELIEP